MNALLQQPGLPDAHRIALHFGLGQTYDDIKDYAAAIRHFDAGNRLARQGMLFDRGQFGAGVNRLIASFTAEFFSEHAALGSADEMPVLIVGMPRSGTTLVEQIVSSHPQIDAAGELEFWRERAEGYGKAGPAAPTPAFMGPVQADYLDLLRRAGRTAARVTDRMPTNFLWLGIIHLAFPKARIIHCRRHPIDTCLSNYLTHSNVRPAFACDRGDLAFYYRCYQRLMAHWREVLPANRLLDIDYEDLVANREGLTRKLIAFCGMEWHERCLPPEITESQKAASTSSARQAPQTRSLARRQNYAPWLGELRGLADLGVPPPPVRRSGAALGHLRRAAALRADNKLTEAIAALLEAARLSPNDPWVVNESGLMYLQRHAYAEAVDAFERAIALDPTFSFAHYNLACGLERLRRPDAAIVAYREAIAVAPAMAEAHSRLGNLLHAQGRREEALASFRRAYEVAADTTLGRLNGVKLLLEEEKPGNAEALLRRIVTDDPKSSEGWRLLGNCLRETGRFAEAETCLLSALERDPTQVAAFHDLVHAKRLSEADRPLVGRIEERLRRPDLTDAERGVLHFAAGKGFDDLGMWEQAIRHFDAGNRIEHAGLRFDRAAFAAGINRLISLFTPERLAEAAVQGDPSDLPVLIVGMPRSGTTLVEQIVSSHPLIGAGGELRFWNEHAGDAIRLLGTATDRHTASEYLALLRRIAPEACRIADKMPFNFLWTGLVHFLLPGARILHCRRNPVDTCLSIYFTRFATRQDFAYERGDLVFYYRQYERIMRHWRAVIPRDRFLDVDYDGLVRNRDATSRELIAFIGLDWSDACLRPERNQRVVKTASMWQARQPVYTRSLERWRHYEPWLGELKELIGTG